MTCPATMAATPPVHRRIGRVPLSAVLAVLAVPASATAVVRTCGPDALVNTATVLCAPPSGPCTAERVVLGANVRVPKGGCRFDLGGRDLEVARTFTIGGGHRLEVLGAMDVVVTRRGRLKARGGGRGLPGGGEIRIEATGTVVVDGLLDVSGDSAGFVDLLAGDDVVLGRRAVVRGTGLTRLHDTDGKFADGAVVTLLSFGGDVRTEARILLRGADEGSGGDLDLLADRSLAIGGSIDMTGGGGGGGYLFAIAGDDLDLSAPIDARSRAGAGDGGGVDLVAGQARFEGVPDGIFPGGTLHVRSPLVDLRGHVGLGIGGFGGDLLLVVSGTVRVAPETVVLAYAGLDGVGGDVDVFADGVDGPGAPPVLADVAGVIDVRGGSRGAGAGFVTIESAESLRLAADVDLDGPAAGELRARAGGDLEVDGSVRAVDTRIAGASGRIALEAGALHDGALRVRGTLRSGGALAGVRLAGCTLALEHGTSIDARPLAGLALPSPGVHVALVAAAALEIAGGVRVQAGAPTGGILVTHPAEVTPVVGAGAVLAPPPIDDVASSGPYPAGCGR